MIDQSCMADYIKLELQYSEYIIGAAFDISGYPTLLAVSEGTMMDSSVMWQSAKFL